jgi:HlyD family secretion protein
MQVNASVDEADIGNVSTVEDVQFTVDAYPNNVFPAKISEIRLSPQTVQNVVTYSVILSIDNSERKLRPGMTANITLTVDHRENVLRIPNAGLRYTPPGQTRPEPQRTAQAIRTGEEVAPGDGAASAASSSETTPSSTGRLAPGQKWDPANKIKFSAPRKRVERSGLLWVLDAQGKPEMREVVVGITDGSSTELISGGLKSGDAVVIGDSTQAPATTSTQQRGGFGFGPPPGGGGRGPF